MTSEQSTDETEHRTLDWVRGVESRLREDETKALRIDRSGYVAFLKHSDGYHFEVIHRHYHEDEWRHDELTQTQLPSAIARFSNQSKVVEMPDLDDVEVTLDAGS